MVNDPPRVRPTRHEDPADDVDAAIALLRENSTLLTGRAPVAAQRLPGRAHLHRVSLYWPPRDRGCHAVCLQVLPVSTGPTRNPHEVVEHGWYHAESQAIAESLDLRLHAEGTERAFESFLSWRRTTGVRYYLALVDQSDPPIEQGTLDQRCSDLEAGYLDGAAWIRFYSARQFVEGSFSRLLQHLSHEARSPRATEPPDAGSPTTTRRGLC